MIINIKDLKKKIIYRANYRGTKEMDKLLGSFIKIYIDQLNDEELSLLSNLLDLDDEDLYKLNDKDLKDLEEFLNIDDDSLYKFYNDQITLSNILNTNIGKLFKNFKYKL